MSESRGIEAGTSARPAAAKVGAGRLFLHELGAQQKLFWRAREAAFFTFFLPVIFFLIFGSVYGDTTIKEEGGIKGSWFQIGRAHV